MFWISIQFVTRFGPQLSLFNSIGNDSKSIISFTLKCYEPITCLLAQEFSVTSKMATIPKHGISLYVELWTNRLLWIKVIVRDSNNIFLWHESGDVNKKSLFPKFQLIPIWRFQVMHDYVCFTAPIDYCVE